MRKAARVLLVLLALRAFAVSDVAPQFIGPSALSSYFPLVASNGNGFLAIWAESLAIGRTEWRGALIDAAGMRLTLLPFAIAPWNELTQARLVRLGDDYLLVGYDNQSYALHTVTITASGVVIRDAVRLPFVAAAQPAVATIGNTILLVSRPIPGESVVAAFMDRDGTLLKSENLGVATMWAAASNATEFDVAAFDGAAVVLSRFSQTGALIERRIVSSVLSGAVVQILTVAAAPAAVLVAWSERPPFSPSTNLRVATVAAGHDLVISPSVPLSGSIDALSAAWVNDSFIVIAKQPLDSTAARFASNGGQIGGTVRIDGGGSVAGNDRIAYSVGQRSCCGPIIGTAIQVNAALQAGAPTILNLGPRLQRGMALGSDGVDFLALWRDVDWTADAAFIRSLDRNGAPNQSAIHQLATTQTYWVDSALASIGSTYLALFTRDSKLYGQRLSAAGDVIDPPIEISANNVTIAVVAASANRFFVMWNDTDGTRGRFITADGSASQPFLVMDRKRSLYIHRVAFDGRRFVALFQLPSTIIADPFTVPPAIYAARIDANGALLDQEPIKLFPFVDRVHIASDTRDFLVVADIGKDVVAQRLEATDTALVAHPSRTLFTWTSTMQSDVRADGADYVVAWTYSPNVTLDASRSWLALKRMDSSFNVRSERSTETGFTGYQAFTLATNSLGDVVMLVSESRDSQIAPRLRTYTERDLNLRALTRPPAPYDIRVKLAKQRVYIQWSYFGEDASSFLIESVSGNSSASTIAEVPGSARSASLLTTANTFRVRAVTRGGVSDPSPIVHVDRFRLQKPK